LARQLSGSEPHRKPVGDYEGKAEEGRQRHLPPPPDEGDQADLGEGLAHRPHEEVGALHARQDKAVYRQQGPDDKILM
jgi:hypothetical protein